jgi:hypothetical protein
VTCSSEYPGEISLRSCSSPHRPDARGHAVGNNTAGRSLVPAPPEEAAGQTGKPTNSAINSVREPAQGLLPRLSSPHASPAAPKGKINATGVTSVRWREICSAYWTFGRRAIERRAFGAAGNDHAHSCTLRIQGCTDSTSTGCSAKAAGAFHRGAISIPSRSAISSAGSC